jgi:nitric oxide reductase large subunit
VPLASDWEERPFLTHIVTIWTRQEYVYWIYMHLLSASLFVLPVKHPVVPSGQSRLRVTFHAENTTTQVISLVEQIYGYRRWKLRRQGHWSSQTSICMDEGRGLEWLRDGLESALVLFRHIKVDLYLEI